MSDLAPELSVHRLDVLARGDWAFRDGSLRWNHPHVYGGGTFDPFPGYAHDIDIAREEAGRAAKLVPPLYSIEIHLANREEVGRTNGYSSSAYYTVDGDPETRRPLGLIVLSGKRIPPHPAMTRYLVGHEYGHHACWMIGKLRGATNLQDEKWLADYAKVRGLEWADVRHHGAGGNWHDALSEIVACDFRITVLGIEPDYWPHPGIPRPGHVEGLGAWWADIVDQLRNADPVT